MARIFIPVLCGIWGLFFETPFQWLQPPWLVVAGALVGFVGTLPSSALIRRWLPNAPSRAQRRRDFAVRALILYPHVWLTGAVLLVIPREVGPLFVGLLGVWALGIVAATRGDQLRLAQALGFAHPAPVSVEAMTTALAQRMNTRPPRLFSLSASWANAAAFVMGGRICYSESLDGLLAPDELEAILAHELAHLAEPLPVRLARSAGIGTMLLPLVLLPFLSKSGWWTPLPALGFALLLVLFLRRLGRRMEERADRLGQAHAPESAAFARGLEKIYQANHYPMVVTGRTTHPSLYDCLVSAGHPPPYPRPAPPSAGRRRAGASVLAIPLVLTAMVSSQLSVLQGRAEKSVAGLQASLAWTGNTAWKLGELARLRDRAGDHHLASLLYRAAAELEPRALFYANLALVLVSDRQCREAREAAEHAWALDEDNEHEEFMTRVGRYVANCE
jgi:Zn-dependent protease with chaperone function